MNIIVMVLFYHVQYASEYPALARGEWETNDAHTTSLYDQLN